jgi:hypothetical protein
MQRVPDLRTSGATLDHTIVACQTPSAWIDAATRFFTVADLSEAPAFLANRCQTTAALGDARLCQMLAGE